MPIPFTDVFGSMGNPMDSPVAKSIPNRERHIRDEYSELSHEVDEIMERYNIKVIEEYNDHDQIIGIVFTVKRKRRKFLPDIKRDIERLREEEKGRQPPVKIVIISY